MAKVGIGKLTYAKYQSGGDGSSIVYTGGKMKTDYLCKADLQETRDSTKEYADDHQIDSDKALTAVTLALEIANNDTDIKKDILGHVEDGDDMVVTGDDAPFIGIGYLMKNRYKKTVTYEGIWVHKAQFATGGVSAESRRENTAFGHETLNGDASGVILTEGGKTYFYAHRDGMDESTATAWLKTKAGITT